MVSERRIGAPDAKNRTVLLDAAEQLMLEEGYTAVTSRRVARAAGLKSQLVHYYFGTMDELFLALFERRAEEGLKSQRELLDSERPLRALWEFSTDGTGAAFTTELTALANHRPAIRAEVLRYAEKFRAMQVESVTEILRRYRISPQACPPAVLVVLMAAIGRVLGLEDNLGLSLGHDDAIGWLTTFIDEVEGDGRAAGKTRRATRKVALI
ncbi:MAG TPA: helix-turn-helix domain-containing protein [Pseudonocardiaceae bacterium]|jgi:AcrR family transcriptional regulator|nr:helix-turn-helix domain-containing protein [Pseudonocardiaceae bacterium]